MTIPRYWATLRDWLEIPASRMLPSARIKAAPTIANVLAGAAPRLAPPETVLVARTELAAFRVPPEVPPNDLQKSIIVAMETKRIGRTLAAHEVHDLLAKIPTRGHLVNYLKLTL